MRTLMHSVVGVVAAGLLSAGCFAAPATEQSTRPDHYVFEGRLGYRSVAGTLVPVVPDTVLVGWGEGACQFTLQTPEAVAVDAKGRFTLTVADISIGVVRYALLRPDGSADAPTCSESSGWPCYRFRASGCNDRALQFGPVPPPAIVEMDCPGRRGDE